MTHEQRIAEHRARVQLELAAIGREFDPLAGFRGINRNRVGRPANAASVSVLLSRLRRLELMCRNPGWSL